MMKKAVINGRMLDIVPIKEAIESTNESNNNIAIEANGCILPVRGSTDKRPGAYRAGSFYMKTVMPDSIELPNYRADDNHIVDFTKAEDIRGIIKAESKLRNLEVSRLTTIDNICAPRIRPDDAPEMVGLKKAIIQKHIDLDKYEQRFGDNYNNDRRLLEKDNITLTKLKTFAKALDMKLTLTFEDNSKNVPNPIGEPIRVTVIGGEDE